ncbi:hypothetical protein F2Q68_00004721 [Brassica cretica]|uniref:BED-type domain-containing protein n=1 Tax=Brassica cretica TaxID=69181 RepID=A0A8S9J9Y9_BRACR|nr:hypothetical protein F2Q68_00004721 [Brassica cretica]
MDFESQQLLATLEAAAEADDATNLRKQSTYGTGRALNSKTPILQSTLDGGIGSSPKVSKSKTKTKSVQFTIRGGRKSSRPAQGNGKKNTVHAESSQPKNKIHEEQIDLEDEFEEDEMKNQKEGKHWSDVWPDFTKIRKPNGEEKAKCNYCKNEYAWSSHGHGTTAGALCDPTELEPVAGRVIWLRVSSFAISTYNQSLTRLCTDDIEKNGTIDDGSEDKDNSVAFHGFGENKAQSGAPFGYGEEEVQSGMFDEASEDGKVFGFYKW